VSFVSVPRHVESYSEIFLTKKTKRDHGSDNATWSATDDSVLTASATSTTNKSVNASSASTSGTQGELPRFRRRSGGPAVRRDRGRLKQRDCILLWNTRCTSERLVLLSHISSLATPSTREL
jgi:hypothetical protein